jgi:hypothetical protein
MSSLTRAVVSPVEFKETFDDKISTTTVSASPSPSPSKPLGRSGGNLNSRRRQFSPQHPVSFNKENLVVKLEYTQEKENQNTITANSQRPKMGPRPVLVVPIHSDSPLLMQHGYQNNNKLATRISPISQETEEQPKKANTFSMVSPEANRRVNTDQNDHGFSPMPETTPAKTPKRGTPMPHIMDSKVTMERPDPCSKFHNGPGPVAIAVMTPVQEAPREDDHGFSPMLETTPAKTLKRGTPMPHIMDSKVTMESPDPCSKFHNGPGPVAIAVMTPVQEAPREDDHGFSPMPETTPAKTPKRGTPMPHIMDSKVTMESPDPCSKFHNGVSRVQEDNFGFEDFENDIQSQERISVDYFDAQNALYVEERDTQASSRSPSPTLIDAEYAPENVINRAWNQAERVSSIKDGDKYQFGTISQPGGIAHHTVPPARSNRRRGRAAIEANRTQPLADAQSAWLESTDMDVKDDTANESIEAPLLGVKFVPRPPPQRVASRHPSTPPKTARGRPLTGAAATAAMSMITSVSVTSLPVASPLPQTVKVAEEEKPETTIITGASFRRGRIFRSASAPVLVANDEIKPTPTPTPDEVVPEYIVQILSLETSSNIEDDVTQLEKDQEEKMILQDYNANDCVISDMAPTFSGTCSQKAPRAEANFRVTYCQSTFQAPKSEKKRRRKQLGPYSPELETLLEDEDGEQHVCYPTWMKSALRKLNMFRKVPYPVNVTVCPSEGKTADAELCDLLSISNNFDEQSNSDELGMTMVGRIRRKRAPGSESQPEVLPTPDIKTDTYGKWMEKQTPSIVLYDKENISQHANNQTDKDGIDVQDMIFLHIQNQELQQLHQLIIRNPDVVIDGNCRDVLGNTPLIAASCIGARRFVRLLLKHGCAIDEANMFGNTALHFARELGFDAIVRQLNKRGACIGAVNTMGCIPGQRVDVPDEK